MIEDLKHMITSMDNIPIEVMKMEPIRDYKLADRKYEILKQQIQEFQENLSDDVDVCVQLASFGASIIMYVSDIGFQNPDILYFWGFVNGNEAQLIQHISQLNFMLMAVKKQKPEDKPRRIGFCADDSNSDENK